MWVYFLNITGLKQYYNYLHTDRPADMGYYIDFLQLSSTKDAIHAGNITFNHINETVNRHLLADKSKSTTGRVEELLDIGYRTMFYVGQLDIIVFYKNTDKFIRALNWKGKDAFNAQHRQIWKLNDDLAGYARQVEPLTHVMVHAAGHMAPYDQPQACLDMINKFITKVPFQ